jgi:hypothetical protein
MNRVCPFAAKKGIIGNKRKISRKKCKKNEDRTW